MGSTRRESQFHARSDRRPDGRGETGHRQRRARPAHAARAHARPAGNAHNAQGVTEHERALIGDTLVDLDGVLRMFSSLTRISQIEANGRTEAVRAVNLSEVAREVGELFD